MKMFEILSEDGKNSFTQYFQHKYEYLSICEIIFSNTYFEWRITTSK